MFAVLQEPHIVLIWLMRLRWLAIGGQVAAITVAWLGLGVTPPLLPAALVILITGLTNLAMLIRRPSVQLTSRLIPAILLLDIGLLTVLLFCTGGPDNPFSVLYLVHVAMAVGVVGFVWTWIIVLAAAGCYGLLFWKHWPLPPLPPSVALFGNWGALVLVACLIAYFIGRITAALRQRERELSTVRERAAKNELLASLTTLAAGAAHELGTPLGTIALVAKEIELTSTAPNPALAEDARLIRREVDRCRAIIDRMRGDVAADSRQKSEPMCVNDLIREVRQDLRDGEADRLEAQIPPGLEHLVVPRHAVRQALGVLVRNAFDASRDGQKVTLAIRRERNRAVFEVIDRGEGMSADTLRHAGEPFFTTKPPGAGMGLGLFLVRLVAERYDGTFLLDSKLGVGTRSTLSLPEARMDAVRS